MPHFAEIDTATNTVLRILVLHNDVTTIDGVEDEQRGIDFFENLLPESGTWVQTSYNANMRGEYATVGGTYDSTNDRFIKAQPYPSWVLDENFVWQAPIPHPGIGDGQRKRWDESVLSWVSIDA